MLPESMWGMSANVVVYVPLCSGFGLCWLGCISHYIVSASWRLLLISEGECHQFPVTLAWAITIHDKLQP